MAPQPSSLRTSFRVLSITRIEIKESVIYAAEGRDWGRGGKRDFLPKIELNDASVGCGARLFVGEISFNYTVNARGEQPPRHAVPWELQLRLRCSAPCGLG